MISIDKLKSLVNEPSNDQVSLRGEYRRINLSGGEYIQIKYDLEGIFYDRFDKNDEHIESYGFDLYIEIRNLIENNY